MTRQDLIEKLNSNYTRCSAYERMKECYENNAGRKIVFKHPSAPSLSYEGVVCRYHFAWDDFDHSYLIIAIEKSVYPGIQYYQRGDVYVTHKQHGNGYGFIHVSDFWKYDIVDPKLKAGTQYSA